MLGYEWYGSALTKVTFAVLPLGSVYVQTWPSFASIKAPPSGELGEYTSSFPSVTPSWRVPMRNVSVVLSSYLTVTTEPGNATPDCWGASPTLALFSSSWS